MLCRSAGGIIYFLKTNPGNIHSRIYPKVFLTYKSEKMKKGSFILSAVLVVFAIASLAFKPAIPADKVVWTQVVQLDAMQANTESEAMGVAIFRLTADMKLTYKIIVQKNDENDPITAAHIHYGAAGTNGGVAIDLSDGIVSTGKNITTMLTEAQYQDLMEDALYVNVHSTMYPSGVIRGQIR